MEVRINNQYTIETDERNYVLKRTILTKPRDGGEPQERSTYNYFWTLEHFCDSAIEKIVRDSNASSFEEIKYEIKKAKEEIIACLESKGFKEIVEHVEAVRAGKEPEQSNAPIKKRRGRPKGVKNLNKKGKKNWWNKQ